MKDIVVALAEIARAAADLAGCKVEETIQWRAAKEIETLRARIEQMAAAE